VSRRPRPPSIPGGDAEEISHLRGGSERHAGHGQCPPTAGSVADGVVERDHDRLAVRGEAEPLRALAVLDGGRCHHSQLTADVGAAVGALIYEMHDLYFAIRARADQSANALARAG